eukprot:scaffold187707_cov28-Tisochrysis_lutea.AAC.1
MRTRAIASDGSNCRALPMRQGRPRRRTRVRAWQQVRRRQSRLGRGSEWRCRKGPPPGVSPVVRGSSPWVGGGRPVGVGAARVRHGRDRSVAVDAHGAMWQPFRCASGRAPRRGGARPAEEARTALSTHAGARPSPTSAARRHVSASPTSSPSDAAAPLSASALCHTFCLPSRSWSWSIWPKVSASLRRSSSSARCHAIDSPRAAASARRNSAISAGSNADCDASCTSTATRAASQLVEPNGLSEAGTVKPGEPVGLFHTSRRCEGSDILHSAALTEGNAGLPSCFAELVLAASRARKTRLSVMGPSREVAARSASFRSQDSTVCERSAPLGGAKGGEE